MRLTTLQAVFAICAILAASACKEPEGIGLEVLPDGEQMPIAWVDTFSLEVSTITHDSVPTSGINSQLIGDFNDPIFGRLSSELFFQFKPSESNLEFPSDAVVDSMILNLAYSGSYGNTDKLKGLMQFGVYELTEDLYPTCTAEDSTYYSRAAHSISTTPLADFTLWPNLYSEIETLDGVLSPSMRVPLNSDLGTRIINSANLASDEVFVEEFKGLNVKPIDLVRPSGTGSILNLDVNSSDSQIEMYYHTDNEDTIRQFFPVTCLDGVHTAFSHEFSPEVTDALTGGTASGANTFYIQSMASLRAKIEIPHLKELNQLGYVAINKAELLIPIDQSVVSEYGVPTSLFVTGIDSGDAAVFVVDQFEGPDYYGGVYDSENKEYIFNIARHLQSILNNPEEEDYGLYVVNAGTATTAARGVFNGPEHATKPMKLRMTYTIIE
jgi:hypothetical protein